MRMKNIDSRETVIEGMLGYGSWHWTIDCPDQIEASIKLCELLQIERVDYVNIKKLESLIVAEERKQMMEYLDYQLGQKAAMIDLYHNLHISSKEPIQVNNRMTCFYDEKGQVEEIIGVCVDLSFNNRRDYSTRLNDEKFYRLFGDSPMGIAMLKPDGDCFLSNKSLVERLGYKDYEMQKTLFQSLVYEEDQPIYINLFSSMVSGKMNSFKREFRLVHKGGNIVWYEMTITTVRDIQQNLKYLFVMLQESVRGQKNSTHNELLYSIKEEIMELSLKDNLSGLYNRQYALKRLKEMVLGYYENYLSFSVLLIDVNHLSDLNKEYGHACGDRLIREISEFLKATTRDSDVCARWGGEKFIVIFPEIDEEKATELAERIRSDVSHTIFMWENKEIHVTVNISVTAYQPEDTLNTFIAKIDDALYKSKANEAHDHVRRI